MSAVNTFAGERLDRAGPRRTDESWLAERRADPVSRAVLSTTDGVLVRDGATPALAPLGDLPAGIELVLLGVDERGAAIFAADPGPEAAAALDPQARLRGLRDVAGEAAPADAGLLAHATGLLNWHRHHRFCANCGAPTEPAEAGHVRTCPHCGAHHHPRTDPVIITLVHDGAERVLLGRQPTWPEGRYSTLAGFVEPGESLEEAVVREIGEESGVAVSDVRYRSSQPWPFPASIMLGFEAAFANGDPYPHDHELADVRWVSRAELERAVAGNGPLKLPPPLAIARRLIEGWLDRTR